MSPAVKIHLHAHQPFLDFGMQMQSGLPDNCLLIIQTTPESPARNTEYAFACQKQGKVDAHEG